MPGLLSRTARCATNILHRERSLTSHPCKVAIGALMATLSLGAQAQQLDLNVSATLTSATDYVSCNWETPECVPSTSNVAFTPLPWSQFLSVDLSVGGSSDLFTFDFTGGDLWRYQGTLQTLASQPLSSATALTTALGMLKPFGITAPADAVVSGTVGATVDRGIWWSGPDSSGQAYRQLTVQQNLSWMQGDTQHWASLLISRSEQVTGAPLNQDQPMSAQSFMGLLRDDFWCATCTNVVNLQWETTSGAISHSLQYSGVITQFSASAVPEPASYAMMAAGLGLLGLCIRRRSPSQAVMPGR